MSGVFRNYKNSTSKKPADNVVRDSHPNNFPYRWKPNREFFRLKQPHERGTFFSGKSVSGAGAVGGSNGS